MTYETLDLDCLCSLDDNENIVDYNPACPLHKDLATPAKAIKQRWCSGSSETVEQTSAKTGMCRACRNIVPAKYGVAGVHLPDGTTPRE